ncbi:hypothetical protein JOD15_002310 [Enterococcus ureilyticus]|nr:MepB family protein [Enterococcus ureilyticus]MBM7689597.1 hypothetical protein [Enterococcus ureilyticus]
MNKRGCNSIKSIDYVAKIIKEMGIDHLSEFKIEEQNKAYEGATFEVGNQSFRSRRAKKTPKKLGYFVAFWEKDENRKNQPYDYESAPDKLIITIFDQDKIGQFVFPKSILADKNSLTNKKKRGKMALRLYPDWIKGLNKTAAETQRWQHSYFIDLTNTWDLDFLDKLYFG